MTFEVLWARERPASPWKNSGGVTRQIALFPEGASLANFDWRVSLATVAAAGPFSTFPGVDRLMLVLDGRLILDMAGASPVTLDGASPTFAFPGDAPVTALAPAAPVTDVNVMVRRGRFTARLERRRIAGTAAVVSQDVTLILSRAAGVTVALAAHAQELGPDDVARIGAARGALIRLRSAAPAEVVVVHVNAVR
jgi:environmental stress-induced protein Ves